MTMCTTIAEYANTREKDPVVYVTSFIMCRLH